jgi:hypothetical protein
MNDASYASAADEAAKKSRAESTGRVKVVAWMAGLTAFFVLLSIDESPTWPGAFMVACVVAMVTFVCYLILRQR